MGGGKSGTKGEDDEIPLNNLTNEGRGGHP
jgi:hypothetical protein